jgi:hypothetical protein
LKRLSITINQNLSFGVETRLETQLQKAKSQKMSMSLLLARSTNFYSIVPIGNGSYVLLIDNLVIGIHSFHSIEEAEDYVIYNYNSLKEEAKMQRKHNK